MICRNCKVEITPNKVGPYRDRQGFTSCQSGEAMHEPEPSSAPASQESPKMICFDFDMEFARKVKVIGERYGWNLKAFMDDMNNREAETPPQEPNVDIMAREMYLMVRDLNIPDLQKAYKNYLTENLKSPPSSLTQAGPQEPPSAEIQADTLFGVYCEGNPNNTPWMITGIGQNRERFWQAFQRVADFVNRKIKFTAAPRTE
jgi:hypothetical protein